MTAAVVPGGIVSVDLLGLNDSWVKSPEHTVSSFSKDQVLELFDGYRILKLNERDEPGQTAIGHTKHWHIFSILAVKADG